MRLETARLILRPWMARDRAAYAAFNADAEVRRFYPSTLTRAETDAMVERFIAALERDRFGYLAVERKSDGAFIGDVGLAPVDFALAGNPRVEIGWLLGKAYWGQGYAPEAAQAWLGHAFSVLKLPEIVALTPKLNLPSQRVMEKIGMKRDRKADFEHPRVPEGHPLRVHQLWRIAAPKE